MSSSETSRPCCLKKPSSTAAIAGKYEFEIMSGTASFMRSSSTRRCRRANTVADPRCDGEQRGVAVLETGHLQSERQAVEPKQRQRNGWNPEQRERNREGRIPGPAEAERRRLGRRQGDAGV